MAGQMLDWTSIVDGTNNDNQGDEEVRSLSETGENLMPPYVAVIEEEHYTSKNVAKLVYFASQYAVGDAYGMVEEGDLLQGVLVIASDASSSSSDNNGVQHPLS